VPIDRRIAPQMDARLDHGLTASLRPQPLLHGREDRLVRKGEPRYVQAVQVRQLNPSHKRSPPGTSRQGNILLDGAGPERGLLVTHFLAAMGVW
jgi:hypothetical protein